MQGKVKDQVLVANGSAQSAAAAAGKAREETPVSVDTAMSTDQAREGSAPASSSGKPDIPGTPNLSGIVSNDAPITVRVQKHCYGSAAVQSAGSNS